MNNLPVITKLDIQIILNSSKSEEEVIQGLQDLVGVSLEMALTIANTQEESQFSRGRRAGFIAGYAQHPREVASTVKANEEWNPL